MSNPQTNMLNENVKSSNGHLSGRFAGSNINAFNKSEEHMSTLHSSVNTNIQNNGFYNNGGQQNDSLTTMRNNKFVKQEVVVSNTEIATEKQNVSNNPADKYLNDPMVRTNLEGNKNANQLIDTKTMMILGLIVMIFIFVLPMIYDYLNQ